MKIGVGLLLKRALPFALALGIWFTPVPAGLTAPAWHLSLCSWPLSWPSWSVHFRC